jgi:DNA-binding SARP family transcriptional activator/Tfp pilus assembly protein PilF
MFRLRTLGGLYLESVDSPLPQSAGQRRRLILLALLAGMGQRGLTRDKLIGYLWPERREERARHALEQLLYATRRDLGRYAIISDSAGLRLNPAVIEADVVGFDAALRAGDLAAAVGLYGGPFADGVYLDDAPAFEQWVEGERARLQERFAGAMESLAQSASQRGDLQQAIEHWRRLAAVDPLNTRHAMGVIRTLADRGDTSAALREARRHEDLIRSELEMEPDPAFRALVESIASRPVARRPAVPPADAVTMPTESGAAVTRPTPAAPPPAGRSAQFHTRRRRPRAAASPTAWFRRRSLYLALAAAAVAGSAVLVGREVLWRSGSVDTTAAAPDPAALELYLRGRTEWNRRSREGLEQAVMLFRQAAERDPLFVDAFAGLADAYVMLGYLGFAPADAAFPRGRAAAQHALAIDPTHGKAHAALGMALQWERRWTEADEAFRRAVEYAPDYATGHQWYALLLTILGRMEEAVSHARHAADLDPLSIQVQNSYGITYYHARRVDAALEVYARLVTSEPDTAWVRQNPWVLSNFGKVAAAGGRYREAVRLLERAVHEVPRHPRPRYDLAVAHLRAGDHAMAEAAFAPADPQHPHYSLYRGLLHAWLDDLDAAFDWLARIQEWSPVVILTLVGDPWPEALSADRRYAALRRQLELPDSPAAPAVAAMR